MKRLLAILISVPLSSAFCQSASDLFKPSDTRITWLGVDYSHVKLIGDFAQFADAGQKSSVQIKEKYFPGWNDLIVKEWDKYDIRGMLRKDKISIDIDMIRDINANADVETLESDETPDYSKEDIQGFVKSYKPTSPDGIGIAFVAETMNKRNEEAWYHFVAIDLSNNNILIHERLRGEPAGIGIRNYWAGSIYDVIKQIEKVKYWEWKSKHGK